ncbi:hypothetical protein GUITHDRAFT_106396 [Guillardia theta CCMP2712]|uniref:Major facilitator superfamily associated domain-containing protein n=1 Tax=Guillardia theta (strain CCMP2712) TaxID=905079 RepID=L1JH61_GUITC|nr:hypothetical protein GUITHDRAFT_106396 [Guillardia theta CCMP2712]EKX47848.1 hypothetical protein GUITHDRAFT_106396 [Guillardia theta CCMP2712]|eukprot:XP_005834828.1 hypothetical protein GUITHDRAFT_106396 [Guillardia theta CCMP2712]
MSTGISPVHIGMLKSVGHLVKACAQPLWAVIADRQSTLDRENQLFSFSSLALIASIFSMEIYRRCVQSDLYVLFMARIALASLSAGLSLVDVIIADLSSRSREGYGKNRMFYSVSWCGLSLLGGVLIDKFGIGVIFLCTYVFRACLTMTLCYLQYTMPSPHDGSELEALDKESGGGDGSDAGGATGDRAAVVGYRELLQERVVRDLLLSNFIYGFVYVVPTTITVMQLEDQFETGRTFIGAVGGVIIFGTLPAFWFSKSILDKVGLMETQNWTMLLFAVVLFLYSFVTQQTVYAFLVLSAVKGALFALFTTASVESATVNVDSRFFVVTQSAISWCHYTFGAGIGNIFWAFIYQKLGSTAVYQFASIFMLVTYILFTETSRVAKALSMSVILVAVLVGWKFIGEFLED